MNRLLYFARITIYLYGFTCFGLMCLIFIPFVLPLLLLSRCSQQRLEPLIRTITHHSFAFVRWHCRLTGFVDMRFIDHRPKFTAKPGQSQHLLIANHLSMFDIVLLLGYIPGLQTLVNSKFVANPLLRPIIRACGYIPVQVSNPNDGARAYADIGRSLAKGETVVMFPEGTRSADGNLAALKQGPFRIARDRDLVPDFIFFTCNQPFLNRAAFFPKQKGSVILEAHVFAASDSFSKDWRESFSAQYRTFRRSEHILKWNQLDSEDKA